MGEYNKTYDRYSELIITMTGETLVDLSAEIEVATTGVTAALEERQNVAQSMYQYKVASTQIIDGMEITYSYTTSDTYDNYVTKYRQLAVTLWGNVEALFFSGDYFTFPVYDSDTELYSFPVLNYTDSSNAAIVGLSTEDYENYAAKYCKGEFFWRLVLEGFGDDSSYVPPFNSWEDFKEQIVDEKIYEVTGKMGKYKSLYNEVKYWKKERAKVLNKINDLSEQFHRKYEPYIKEGTFSDDNYLDDNEYYWAGVSVLRDSCEPEISYNFEVIDLSPLKVFEDDYEFALGDTTYVEDIDFFGINPHTGFPNREKIIISAISYDLDRPRNNSITA
ncbi:MAG: hypothetical protein LUC37_00345 [Prevotella sp.]|nr:hypothetical protein [Prevotella sp.]